MLRLSTLYFLACHCRMKIWKNKTKRWTMCLHTTFVCCVRFSYTVERFLSVLHLPCEVAVLISCSQTCFFCSQNIGGRSTLLALEHDPPRPLSAHTSGSPHAAYRRWTSQEDSPAVKKVFTPLKHFLKQIKIIPAALKTHSQNQI